MSVLRNLESKLAGLVEGTFSRAFKSEVRPVEIARKLTREMEEHKVQSLSRTYAPNEYAVWLSPDDRKQFDGYERDLANELSGYLLEHARRERIAFVTSPKITFKTDDIEAAIARLQERGFELVDINIEGPFWKEAFLRPSKTHGTLVQVAWSAGTDDEVKDRLRPSNLEELLS